MGHSHSSSQDDTRSVNAGSTATSEVDEAAKLVLKSEAGICSKVVLGFRCFNLVNLDDGEDKSDPMIVLFTRNDANQPWVEVGRTEVISNNLNPVFVQKIAMDYYFEMTQSLLIKIYDVDTGFVNSSSATVNLGAQHDLQGEVQTTLALVMGSHGQTGSFKFQCPTRPGSQSQLLIHGEELPTQRFKIRLRLGCHNLNVRGKVFLLLNRVRNIPTGGQEDVPIYRTELKPSQSANFDVFEVNVSILTGGNPLTPLKFEIRSYDRHGSHNVCGFALSNLEELLSRGDGSQLSLTPASLGSLTVYEVKQIPHPSFLEYIMGGCEVNFSVAIDFTASNRPPVQPDSLHFIDPSGRMNHYQSAICLVGEVLECYDSDKQFPVMGFGGVLPGTVQASHCFPLNFRLGEWSVSGIQGILDAYTNAIYNVGLSGPTYFAPVIGTQIQMIQQAQISQQQQRYYVLMIITDGQINDLQATVDMIVAASHLPLSIVIVGVGNADFTTMDFLDGDDPSRPLVSSTGARPARDIVQFVPLNSFVSPQGLVNRIQLTKAILQEIPTQMVSALLSMGIMPNAPSHSDLMAAVHPSSIQLQDSTK